MSVSAEKKLITDYQYELVEDHHNPGSLRYGVRVSLPTDISPSFPYLNAVLKDTIYDHENGILIGFGNGRRYAFRPHEIQLGMVTEPSEATTIIDEAVELVNRVWRECDSITPSYRERELPPVYEIYKLLPRKNCKECGYPTCLAFAADLRSGKVSLDKCTLLLKPEYSNVREMVIALFDSDRTTESSKK